MRAFVGLAAAGPCCAHPLSHARRRLAGRCLRERREWHGWYPDAQIDPVPEGARESSSVAVDCLRRAAAGASLVPLKFTWAGGHGDEHEPGREDSGMRGSRVPDSGLFERLSQALRTWRANSAVSSSKSTPL